MEGPVCPAPAAPGPAGTRAPPSGLRGHGRGVRNSSQVRTEAEAGTGLSPRVNKPRATQLQGADADVGHATPPAPSGSHWPRSLRLRMMDGPPPHCPDTSCQAPPCGHGAQGGISVPGQLRSLTTALAEGWALGALRSPQPPFLAAAAF